MLASAADDKTVRLGDAKTGILQQMLKGHSGCIAAIAFSPDGTTLTSASDNEIWLWGAKTSHEQAFAVI